jgi:cytoskeleton protein RodZ
MTPTENSATSLGGHLRALREARGGSLEDMARSTRVGIRHLEALEEERLADLPSPVFVRGFIRAYCGFLREGPEEALAFYEALAGERAAMQAASAPPRPRTTWAPSSVLVGLALLVILAIALIVVNLTVKRTGGTSVAAPAMDVSAATPIPQPTPPRPPPHP